MTETGAIIGLGPWLQSPAGRYLLAWEQQHLDQAVADIFGFHAVQLGLPQLDALRANRMPHRWMADGPLRAASLDGRATGLHTVTPAEAAVSLRCDFDALPFEARSLDLVVLPHALELARDPHATLGEVERVLRPEGRVVIVGFNPTSLWGLRRSASTVRTGLRIGAQRPPFLHEVDEAIGYRRLRDWLRLLSFEVEAGRFGCYRPPFDSVRWLDRFGWTERAGDRWWPVFGAVYTLTAVKRVRGMRLVGLAKSTPQRAKAGAAPAVVTNTQTVESRDSLLAPQREKVRSE